MISRYHQLISFTPLINHNCFIYYYGYRDVQIAHYDQLIKIAKYGQAFTTLYTRHTS